MPSKPDAAAKTAPVPQGGDPIPAAVDAARTPEGDSVEARVLIAFEGHQPNEIIADTAAAIEALRVGGLVDPHPDAVAAARA